MSTYFYTEKKNGEYIFDNFPKDILHLVHNKSICKDSITIKIDDVEFKARFGFKENDYGIIYVLTTDSKFINRYKLFKELLDTSSLSIRPNSEFQNSLIEQHSGKYEEFIHNVTSLNSYIIQSLFAFVPQHILSANINKQVDFVKGRLTEKPNVAGRMILKLIKFCLATKVEFSVFERTLQLHQVAQKSVHPIRSIVLDCLQIFMEDFETQRITVSLGACERRLNIDYDSLFVSIYYILDNAIKYCCKNTDFKIFFNEEEDCLAILFKMISVRIEENEINLLTKRNYRSKNVAGLNAKGNGIGMYRISKTLNFNDAQLEIIPRFSSYTKTIGEIQYECNLFKIKFIGQQDWFKV